MKSFSNFEYNYLLAAYAAGYQYIWRDKNNDILISKEEPKWSILGWKYNHSCTERTKLFAKGFSKISCRYHTPCAIRILIALEHKGDYYVEKEEN